MEEQSICAPLLAESDTKNIHNSHYNVASVSDADTVINTNNTNSSQIEDLGKGHPLRGLLTDSRCHVCEASLLFESQRVAHYEGKKHAQKVRLYLQAKKDEKLSKDPGGFQRGVTVHKDRFCELCSMVFSSPVVARSHYDGKVHAKNLRKQGLHPAPQTKATSFTCPVCNVELNSVEMYQSHMQGNKHQIKEKKVVDLCKSQKKVYDSFAEELADYIHVQKARGIAPHTSFGIMKGEQEGEGVANLSKVDGQNKTTPSLPSSSRPHLPVIPESYPPHIWSAPYQAPQVQFGFRGNMYEQTAWGHTFPQPLPPGSTLTGLIGRPQPRGGANERSSSSTSYTTSSSSYTSSSDSDCDHHYRERKRKRRKMRKESRRSAREENPEDRKRRRGRRGGNDTEGRGRREPDFENERGSRKRKGPHRSSRSHGEVGRAKRRQEGEAEGAKEEKERSTEKRAGVEGEETEVYMQAELQEETKESCEVRETRAKHRKDKKRTKERVDTRTEEEKLWDESIIGL